MARNLQEFEVGKWYLCAGPAVTKVVKIVEILGKHRFKGIIASPMAGPGADLLFDEDADSKILGDAHKLVEGKSAMFITGWYEHVLSRMKESITAETPRIYATAECVLALGLEKDAGDMVSAVIASKVADTNASFKFVMVPADKLHKFIRKEKVEVILEPASAAMFASGKLVIPDKEHKSVWPTQEVLDRVLEFV